PTRRSSDLFPRRFYIAHSTNRFHPVADKPYPDSGRWHNPHFENDQLLLNIRNLIGGSSRPFPLTCSAHRNRLCDCVKSLSDHPRLLIRPVNTFPPKPIRSALLSFQG